ncbi:MAG: hypothetical protein OXC38_07805 [Gammaproteobacteria bacterium]|nr:hypothetical protein [Gammaproteobacteria bacterium]
MKQGVTDAIEELKKAFPSSTVTYNEDGQGGAHVFVESVDIGERFVPSATWMGGHITAHHPYADIYPVFIDATVCRVDGQEFNEAVTHGHSFADRPAIQISRRNNRIQNNPQTAVAKFMKIIDFLEKMQ